MSQQERHQGEGRNYFPTYFVKWVQHPLNEAALATSTGILLNTLTLGAAAVIHSMPLAVAGTVASNILIEGGLIDTVRRASKESNGDKLRNVGAVLGDIYKELVVNRLSPHVSFPITWDTIDFATEALADIFEEKFEKPVPELLHSINNYAREYIHYQREIHEKAEKKSLGISDVEYIGLMDQRKAMVREGIVEALEKEGYDENLLVLVKRALTLYAEYENSKQINKIRRRLLLPKRKSVITPHKI